MSHAAGPRVLELYCGIGGCAAALGDSAVVVAAVDINRRALDVYRHNFPHPVMARALESLRAAELERWAPDVWWLSPPCQPFTRRGSRRDDTDPRSRSLLRLMRLVERLPPPLLALENVPGFAGSRTHRRLRAVLDGLGYEVRELLLCPSKLGLPNRRRRFYLVAGRDGLPAPAAPAPVAGRTLASCLDRRPAAALWVEPALIERYRHALDVVDSSDPAAVTACFTAAYGRSPVRSGSYLATPLGPRRFSPAEILRLLGFPESYRLPPDLPLSAAWRLAGNSLSVDVVRRILSLLPEPAP